MINNLDKQTRQGRQIKTYDYPAKQIQSFHSWLHLHRSFSIVIIQIRMQDKSTPSPCLRKLVTFLYFLHLVIALALATYIITQHHEVTRPSITFATLLIYGFMLPWALVISFLLILCRQQQKAVCLTRILLKLIIMLFPIFGLLCVGRERELMFGWMRVFLLYMGVVAVLLMLYQVLSCCCWGQKYPGFLFEENNLEEAQDRITNKRKQYDNTIAKQ